MLDILGEYERQRRRRELRDNVIAYGATVAAAAIGTLIGVVVAWWWRGVMPWQ